MRRKTCLAERSDEVAMGARTASGLCVREALEGGSRAMLGGLRRSWGALYTAREGRSKWKIMRSEKQSVARVKDCRQIKTDALKSV